MSTIPFVQESFVFPLLPQFDAAFPDPPIYSLQSGLMVVSAVKAAVELDLAHHIHLNKSKKLTTLAEEIEAHEPSLYLLLCALASIGICEEIDATTHTFAHTDRSRLLQSDADIVRLATANYQWNAWQHLSRTVRTGQSAIEGLYGEGENIWTLLQHNPEESRTFQHGLTVVAQMVLPPLCASYDFSEVTHLVDVGGGHGNLVVQVLHRYPALQAPFTKFFTLQMAIMMGGAHHRTIEEHTALFASVGFELTRAIPLGLEQLALEFRRTTPRGK